MIKIGTDFSGIGSPEQALIKLGIEHRSIFACDYDKYSKQSYLANYNTDIFYDDITKRNQTQTPYVDLYVAGFPCQAFSIAGNRERIFIVGFREDKHTFNFPKKIPLELKLKDILQDNPDSKYYLNNKSIEKLEIYNKRNEEKGNGFRAKFHNPETDNMSSLKVGGQAADDLIEVDEKYYLSDKAVERIKRHNNKSLDRDISATLTAGYFKGGGRDQQYIRTHSLYPRSSKTGKGVSGPLSKDDGTTYCIDTGNAQAIEWIADYRNDEGLRIRKNNVSPCIMSSNISEKELSRMPPIVKNKKSIRRLTPLECLRLQGFPDSFYHKCKEYGVSDTQIYKQAGNSMTVDVMAHLIKEILVNEKM